MNTRLALFSPDTIRTARARLFVLVILVIFPALGVQVYGAWSDLQQDLAGHRQSSYHTAKQAQGEFDALLTETRTVFVDLAGDPLMRSTDNCTQIFPSLRFTYERLAPDASNLGLADADGDIYCAINPVQGEKNIAGQAEFIAAVESMELSLGNYTSRSAIEAPVLSVAYPVLSFDGSIQTVVFATFETRWLETWQEKAAFPAGATLTLFTPEGEVLWRRASGDKTLTNEIQEANADWLRALSAENAAVESPDIDGIVRLNTIIPLTLNGRTAAYFHLGYPVADLYTLAYNNLYWKLGILGGLFLIAMVIAWWGSEALFLRPLNNLMTAVARVQAGDLSARAATVGGLGELAALAQSFDAMTDALERREAERLQMEQRFRVAFESSAIGMGLFTLEGNILAVNAAICAMSGYSEEELKQRNDGHNVYPPDALMGVDLYAEMLEGKRTHYNVERRYVRKNGEIYWASLTLSLVRDVEGKPSYLIGMIEDIDNQKRTLAGLQESEARFRTMFESSAIGIGIMGLDRKVISANPALCQMYGYTRDELVGQTSVLVVHPDDYHKSLQALQDLLAGKFSQFTDERRYVRKNGEVFWARITMSMVRDVQGAPLYVVGMVSDINDERIALANLQESEARFREMFENAAVGISLIAPDGRVLAVNPTLVQLAGRSEEELLAVGGQGITYAEDKEIGRAELGEILAGKRNSFQVEKRYEHKNGRIQWMRQSVSAVRDAQGKALYLVVIAEDIDERKRAVQELSESEARFKAMYNNAAVGMAMMSLDRRILSVNETSARITGYTVEELIDMDPSVISHPEDIRVGMDQFADLVTGKLSQFQMEKRLIRKSGEVFWGRVSYTAVPGKDGKPEYLVGLIEDITEEKEAGRTLVESEERFRTLYNSAEMGIVLVDLGNDGNLPLDDARFNQLVANQRLNPAMLRMFGYTAEELQTRTISSLIYPEDRGIDAQQFRQLLTGEIDSFRIEKRFVRKDGSVFWGRLTDSLARTAAGVPRMVIGIIEDINEERQAKERLASQEAQYRHSLEKRIAERTEELNLANERLREKAALDAVAAERTRLARDLHDAVTQTLFSTTLIADVLPDIWEMNPDEGKRRLEEVRQLTRGALAEMRTLLVELRPNALVEVPLPTLMRQLAEAMAGRSRIHIQLNAEGERKLPAEVQVGLYRIAQEALNNVVKHARASQAVVTLRLGETVRLAVADNGAGFDPSTVTADHLGLKIMRERVEAIGGKLTIYSEPGEGTQISVTWS